MKDRIRAIMESYQLTQQQFAQKLGLGAATISSIFTGRTNPTNNHVQAIHKAFPEISTNWVLFGEGDMLVSERSKFSSDFLSDESQEEDDSGIKFGDISPIFSVEQDSPSLFPEVGVVHSSSPSSAPAYVKKQASATVSPVALQTQLQMAQVAERAPRKIKEIRVFFDDGTFEVFSPMNK